MVHYVLFCTYNPLAVKNVIHYLDCLADLEIIGADLTIKNPDQDITRCFEGDKGVVAASKTLLQDDNRSFLLRARLLDRTRFSEVAEKMWERYGLRSCVYDPEGTPLLYRSDPLGR